MTKFIESVLSQTRMSLRRDPYKDQKAILATAEPYPIFDVGAHLGDMTDAYAKLFPKSLVYSFEPFPNSYNVLKARFKNNVGVKPLQLAISNKPGIVDFYSFAASAGNSLLSASNEAERWADWSNSMVLKDTIKVKVTTVDKFCREQNIDRIMILKMDMQGGELLALEGTKEMLSRKAINLIYSELLFVPVYTGQAEYYQICEFLSRFGYSLFNIYNQRYDISGKLKWCDGLFVETRNL
jgi:FkbM family methyltransferase